MRRLLSSASLIAVAMAMAAPAVAQTAPAATEEGQGIAEIVVTAQRREETLQRTPVTVTAVGAEALEKNNVTSFQNLTAILPNTQVTVLGGARVIIAVRGIRTNDFSPNAEAPVAVHIDGSYISRPSSLSGMFYDIARVESLPGPQGTLYGRNASAGAINIITNRPVNEFQAKGEAEVGNYDLFRGFAMLNVPVTDNLAVRGAYQHNSRSGYDRSGGDSANQDSGRLTALWTPGRARVFLSADYTHLGGTGTFDNDRAAPDPRDNTRIYSPRAASFAGANIKQLGLMAQLDYDLGFATLTAQATNRHSIERSWILGNDELVLFAFKTKSNIGELRLTSNGDGKVQWVVGAFGFDEKQPSYQTGNANTENPFGVGGTCDANRLTPQPVCANITSRLGLRTRSWAGFGQATYSPIEPLHLTAGIRYSDDRKDYAGNFLCGVGATGTAFTFGPCENTPLRLDTGSPGKWNSTDYKLGVSFDVTPTSLLYANYSTGYRSGGAFISPFNPLYGPEKVKNFEVGWKNQFFDRRLVLNVDAYKQKYDDFVYVYTTQGDINPAVGVFQAFNQPQADNLANVDIWGADLTLAWLATPDDLFNLGVEYLHTNIGQATLRCGPPPARDNGPCVTLAFTNPTGKSLPNTPEWRVTTSYEHTFRLAGGATIVPRAQVHWESGRWMDLSWRRGTRQSAYMRSDASITYTSASKRWEVSAWVQNIENHDILFSSVPARGHPIAYPSTVVSMYQAPRTMGVRFSGTY